MNSDFTFFLIVTQIISLAVGVGNGGMEREEGKSGCQYQSLLSVISPGYVVGCELVRHRFNLGGK